MTNSQQNTTQPIGIFDSGIGGLTIAQAIMKLLPQENIIYFGDTAHFPYGEKSIAAIQSYSLKIANLLLQQNCKLILIACNSASSAAYSLLKQHVGSQALVMDVIDPLVSWISQNYAHQKTKMGLIGTKATVHSNVYKKKIDALNLGIELSSYSTNLLASAIEEFGNHEVINGLLSIYLEHPALKNIEALILACTHYPVVKERIAAYYNNKVDIIDSSDIVALAVKSTLEHAKLLNTHKTGSDHFYISDNNLDAFKAGTKLFFNHEIALKPYPLWD
ncbi:MAG TPA: glutamate racemase [Gammaproteobacteria bacterium]|nr:glutamate racemase [Gammaproteobacteria bacterium]